MSVKYSKIYMVSDLSPEDKTFLGGEEFNVYCSDDFEDLASNPKSCQIAILSMVSDNDFLCNTEFEDKTEEGFCWGGYSFDVKPFKYIRIVVNPYGYDEFNGLPSEKDKIRVEFGKKAENVFEYRYDHMDHNSSKNMILSYVDFYNTYKNTHSISAKNWKFPVVYINDKPMYKVTPNGSWDVYKEN